MRRALPCLVALIVLFQVAGSAFAEEPETVKDKASIQSRLGGGISIKGVFREDWFDEVWPRSSATTTTSQNEFFINGKFSLNATVVPLRNVTMFLELETAPDAFGAESHRIGDNANIPQFREAWIEVEDLLGKGTEGRGSALQVGLLGDDLRFDLRNLGRDAFFMDPANAENPYMGLPDLPRHAGGGGASAVTGKNTFLGGNPWYNQLEGAKKASEAGGIVLTLTPHADVHLDFGAFTVMEGGIDDVDMGTNVFFFNFDFEFDVNKSKPGLKKDVTYEDTSLFNIMVTGIQGRKTIIGDAAMGIDLRFLWPTAELEIYAEGHYQNGEYYKKKDPVTGDTDMVPHEAYAAYAGFLLKYKDASEMHPYLDVSAWFLSGDEADEHEKNEDFLSFESVNSFMILESDLGLDIDCNYWAVKAEVGTRLPYSASDFQIRILGGMFSLLETPLGMVDEEESLGIEVDVYLTWDVAEGASLFMGAGFLSGAKFFDEMMGVESSTMMGVGGVEARF